MRKNEKGFTLVELIVVIAIVAILAAVGIIGYTQFIQNARNTKAQSELDQLINVLYADSLVEGITIGDKLVVDVPQQGKVVFKEGITQEEFTALMDRYNDDGEGVLKGEFTLEGNKLTYEVEQGKGEAVVVYAGTEKLTYPAPVEPEGGTEE